MTARPIDRVVVVIGPTTPALTAALTAAGLTPQLTTNDSTVWTPASPAPIAEPNVDDPVGGRPGQALYTIEQAAHRLAIGRSTVYSLIDGGQLRRVRIGRSARIPATDIDRLAASS